MRSDLKSNIKNRIGERKVMNCGEEAEIIEYKNNSYITIKFLKTGELIKCQYNNFKSGAIKSKLLPLIYGIGVTGHKEILDNNGLILRSYDTWHSMLQRCYDEKLQQKYPTYKGCKVCDEWKYYPNFKKWYDENYYEIEGQRMELDKDILNKRNKVYSPETCFFVPRHINSLFIKKDANRGDLPVGVHWNKKNRKFMVQCSVFDKNIGGHKRKYLGLYNDVKEAFDAYKIAKEKNIKQVADYYKDHIPKKLYEAMYIYEVEIDD